MLRLTDFSPKDKKFVQWKHLNQYISDYYYQAGFIDKAGLVRDCASFLSFSLTSESELKLFAANFCRDRFCLVCSYRKRLKWLSRFQQIQSQLKGKWLLITFTFKNCKPNKLAQTISNYQKSFSRLLDKSDCASIPSIQGAIKSLEITRNIFPDGSFEFHPHIHCLWLMPENYNKKSSDWIDVDELRLLWRRINNLDYNPIVRIDYVGNNSKKIYYAVRECVKYLGKPCSFTDEVSQASEHFYPGINAKILEYLYDACYRRRLIETYGNLRKSLGNLEKEKDLIHLSDLSDSESGKSKINQIRFSYFSDRNLGIFPSYYLEV